VPDWNEIVREQGPLVWRVAWRLLGNKADAEDCFQRTFITAFQSIVPTEVRHWPALLQRVATSRALEQLRDRYRQTDRAFSLPETPLLDPHMLDPFEVMVGNELAQELRSALSRIDSRQAEIFCLVCLEESSYPEVAEQLGITANHVGVLLNRAKGALREELQAFQPARRTHCEREQS
jgi:RNA polymerase sigma-70 factor (ECF subfamily)